MQHGMHMIDLAAALEADRKSQIEQNRLAAMASERAGPATGFRRRFGRRLISIGERLAYGRSQVATH